jgi:hypothetical protein
MPTPSLVQMISSDANYYGAGAPTAGVGGTGGQNNFRYNVPNKVQPGNCYLVSATWPDGNTPVLSDNLNGIWPAPIGTVGVGQGNNVSGFFLLPYSLPGWMTITACLSGMPTPPFQWNIKEFCHVIGSGGTSGVYAQAGATLTAGSFTPINNNAGGGNLIVTYCCTSDDNMLQTSAPSSFVPSSGHTLLEANITCVEVQASGGYGFAHAEEYYLQTTSAAINPGFTATGDTANTYNVISIALTVGPAGSPAPAYGPWINKIIHQSTLAWAVGTSVKFQVPWTGNLRFAKALTGGNLTSMTITDSDGYTWVNKASGTGDLIGYAANTAVDPNATITMSGGAGIFGSNYSWVFYDVANMAASPFDQYVATTTYSAGNGGIASNATALINVPSITPSVPCGVCFSGTGLGTGPGLTCSSPQGAIDDYIHYSGENDNDNYDNADCGGHHFFSTDATINWCYTLTPGAGYTDGEYAITFAAATLPGSSGSSGSGVASVMRDPDFKINGWFNENVLPIIEWFDFNEPEGSSLIALFARAFAAASAAGKLIGAVPIRASGLSAGNGQANPRGAAPILGRATAVAMARAQAGAMAALAAKANAQARANANPQGAVPLAARGTGLSAARAAPSGIVGLLARGAAAAMANARIGTGAIIYLLARTFAAATGRPAIAGSVGLFAKSESAAHGQAAMSGVVGLIARGLSAAKATPSAIYKAALRATATAIGSAHGGGTTATISTPTLVGQGVGLSFTTSHPIVAGNLVVMAASMSGTIGETVTGASDGINSYTPALDEAYSGANAATCLLYCENAAAVASGATITITESGGAAACVTVIAQCSGISAFDSSGVGSSNPTSAAGSAPSVTTGILSQSNEIVFGVSSVLGGPAYTESAGFTAIAHENYFSVVDVDLSYRIVSSTTPVTYSPGWSAGSDFISLAAPFMAAMSSGGGQLVGAGALSAAGRASASGRAALAGSVQLITIAATAKAMATGRAAMSGVVGLSARGTVAAAGNAAIRIGAFVNLVARGFAAAAGSAHATGKLGLTAAGQAIAMARAAPGGAVGLLARTIATSKASASIRIGAFVNLVARGFTAAMGSAHATGKLALIATGKGTAAATAAPGGAVGLLARTVAASKAAAAGTWRLALSARSSGAAKSFASARGIVGLIARGAAAAMANARIGTGVGNFVYLLARGFAAAAGAARATGKVGLVASGSAAAAGQAAPSGAVGLLALTAAASKALAFMAPLLDLRVVRFLTGRASAGAIDGKEG